MGVKRTYFAPCFLVTKPCYGNGDIVFRISTHGYAEAYEKAVEKYCEIHDLTDEQYVELLDRMPSTEVFTGYLLNALLIRGHRATKAEILSKLGLRRMKMTSPIAREKRPQQSALPRVSVGAITAPDVQTMFYSNTSLGAELCF